MILHAWLRLGLVSVGTLAVLAGCSDFDRKQCESSWECRQNFGVGSTCDTEEGFCQEVAPPPGCVDVAGLNYPPDIFTSASARETVTLGVMIDDEGQQLARATRLAMEMVNIKGGLSLTGELARYKFSAVVCDLTLLPTLNSTSVGEVARFLRDDVETPAVVLGVNSETLKWATEVLSVREGLTGTPSEVLIVSANSGSLHTDARMRNTANLWTVAASEDSMFRRMGQQLVLRRMEPFMKEAREAVPPEDPALSKEDLLRAAYTLYAADPETQASETFVVNVLALASDSVQSGDSAFSTRRRAALREGIEGTFAEMNNEAATGHMPSVTIHYAERLVSCGTNCTVDDVQRPLEESIGCKGGTSVSDETSPSCDADLNNSEVDAVILHTESRSLLDAFFPALLIDDRFKQAIALETPGQPAKHEVNTVFFLPTLASSGTTAIYSYDWALERDPETAKGLGLVHGQDWFDYVDENRFLGVRQAADPTSAPYIEFMTAGNILLDGGYGLPVYYFAQAYDALWLAMAAITGRTLSLDPYIAPEDAMYMLKEAGQFSGIIRSRFSGATIEELEALGMSFEGVTAEEAEEDLIPSRWQELLTAVRTGAMNNVHKVYRFRGSSGEARFADPNFQVGATPVPMNAQRFGGRERVSYDYAIWSVSAVSRAIDEPTQMLDGSHCLPGIITPQGIYGIPPGEELLPKNRFVCSTDLTLCRTTMSASGPFHDLCLIEK